MHELQARRFMVWDAILLLAALAGGLVLISQNGESWWLDLNAFLQLYQAKGLAFSRPDLSLVARVLTGLTPLLATWTAALWIIRWLPPRPPEADLFRQSGAVAGHVGVITMIVGAAVIAFGIRRNGTPLGELLIERLPLGVSLAVAASWLILAVSRKWQAPRDWVDHSGLLAGTAWVGLLVLYVLARVV